MDSVATCAALPAGLDEFLERAGWAGAAVKPLAGDASFRRYFRLRRGDETAMLMDAPPPHEDPRPFLAVAHCYVGLINSSRVKRVFRCALLKTHYCVLLMVAVKCLKI